MLKTELYFPNQRETEKLITYTIPTTRNVNCNPALAVSLMRWLGGDE
jgi:hypothetical protein